MTVIQDRDVVESVADALQFISYYHPQDFVQAVHRAYEMEQSQAAKDALAQILINSRMCAMGKRPICQTRVLSRYLSISVWRCAGRRRNRLKTLSMKVCDAHIYTPITSSVHRF